MSDFDILMLILVLLLCLLLTGASLVFYTGLLTGIEVRAGAPPVKRITIAYKFQKGSYKDCGPLFTESCSIGPKLSSIGVYYTDISQSQADNGSYAVGSILSENEDKPDEDLQRLYEKFGFRVVSFPEVSCAVTSTFPNRCNFSPICGTYRVIPELHAYITERRLSAYPCLEICKGDVIHYMCPLENQESFLVPELLEKKTEEEKKEDVEDVEEVEEKTQDVRDDNVTQTECCGTVSSQAVQDEEPERREIVETQPVVQKSPQQGKGDGQSVDEEEGEEEKEDKPAKGSGESEDNSSSFEELDMDTEEEEERKEKEKEAGQVEDNKEVA